MKINDINNDAENLIVDNNKIIEIGTKIRDIMPIYLYMGIIKFKYSDFIKLNIFYKELQNTKIDMTSFLNLSIKKKIIEIFYYTLSDFWIEIDSKSDLYLAKKILS